MGEVLKEKIHWPENETDCRKKGRDFTEYREKMQDLARYPCLELQGPALPVFST